VTDRSEDLEMTQEASKCDVATGVCAVPGSELAAGSDAARPGDAVAAGRVRIVYVTDPICSACWVSEPAWRSVTARYGDVLDVEHVYGGWCRAGTVSATRGPGSASPATSPTTGTSSRS
jgi:hypothetical protein